MAFIFKLDQTKFQFLQPVLLEVGTIFQPLNSIFIFNIHIQYVLPSFSSLTYGYVCVCARTRVMHTFKILGTI